MEDRFSLNELKMIKKIFIEGKNSRGFIDERERQVCRAFEFYIAEKIELLDMELALSEQSKLSE